MIAIPAPQRENVGKATAFFVGAVVSALVSTPIAYQYAKRANTTLVFQQQRLTDVQQFEATGAALDNAVRQFSDALVDDRGVEPARQALRTAIATHSSNIFAIRNTLGAADYDRYMAELVRLRARADTAVTFEEGVQVWQSTVNLIGYRRRLTDRIRQQVAAA